MNTFLKEVIIEIIILVLFLKPMFDLSVFTGIGYVIAIIGSLRNGYLFTKPKMGRLIVGGTILSYMASLLLPMMHQSFVSGNTFSFIIIVIIAVIIWIKGCLNHGEDDWTFPGPCFTILVLLAALAYF